MNDLLALFAAQDAAKIAANKNGFAPAPNLRIRLKGNRGPVYRLVRKMPRSAAWVCTYSAVGMVGTETKERRISKLEMQNDYEVLP